jgi:hypothetical protein
MIVNAVVAYSKVLSQQFLKVPEKSSKPLVRMGAHGDGNRTRDFPNTK